MALNINGRMKVKTLKSDFKKEFGLNIRVYTGREFADDDATLASIRKGDAKGGEFSPARNTKVGNLEDKILDMFGLKTQISGSDDSYLCEDAHTLAKALEVDEKLMVKRAKRGDKPTIKSEKKAKVSNTENSSIEDTITKIKEVYKDHEDFDEIVDDLEGGEYFDHWAEKFITEDYGKNVELAKSLFKLLEEKTESFDDFAELASKVADGLSDKEWAKALFEKALTYEADRASDILDLAQKIADEEVLGDKEWAREIVKKALNIADEDNLRSIAFAIINMFEDKDWAKEVYKEAIEKSDDATELSLIGNDIARFYTEEKELSEKAYYKGIEKAEEDTSKFYMKFYIANGILENVDREKGIEIGLSVIDDDRCDAETSIEVARSIARGSVPEFKEKETIVYRKIIDGESSDAIVQLLESYINPEEHEDLFSEAVEKVEEICMGVSSYCLTDLGSAVSSAGEIEMAKRVYRAALDTSEADDELTNLWNNTNIDDEDWLEEFKNELIEKCEEDWAKEEIAES